jgi:LacI family transcriptional regulator
MGRKRVTIEDVARAAGVSRQTVSRAINDLDEISPATRERVLRVAKEMRYRPSAIARGLATQRTRSLGLVVTDVANPFFADVTRGVEQVAYAAGYTVLLCNTDEDAEREEAVLRALEERWVDGVVLCSSRLDRDALCSAVARQPAAVLVNRQLEGGEAHAVLIDDEAGGREAARHLMRDGRRVFGLLTGPVTSYGARRRTAGFHAALAEAGLAHETDRERPCPPTVAGGLESGRDLLGAHPEVTAVFCFNDLVAVGALQACAGLGRRVPDDVAVIGFDDIPLAALVTPSLTTCRVPRHKLGAEATRLLLDEVEDRTDEHAEVVFRPELIVRASAP